MERTKRIKELFTELQSAHLASRKLFPDGKPVNEASKTTLDLFAKVEARVDAICKELATYGYELGETYTVFLLGMKGKPVTLIPEC